MQGCWIALCTQTFENAVIVQFWRKKKKNNVFKIPNIRSRITHFIGLEKGTFCLATAQQLVTVNWHGKQISIDTRPPKDIRYYDHKLKLVDDEDIITFDFNLEVQSYENHSRINFYKSAWNELTPHLLALRPRLLRHLEVWNFVERMEAKDVRMGKRAAKLDPHGEVLVTFEEDSDYGKLDLQSEGKLLGSVPADRGWNLRYLSASKQIIVLDYGDKISNHLHCFNLLASKKSEGSEGSEDDESKGTWTVDIKDRNAFKIHESGEHLFLLTDRTFSILKTPHTNQVKEEVLLQY
jgi:hypothetical protein